MSFLFLSAALASPKLCRDLEQSKDQFDGLVVSRIERSGYSLTLDDQGRAWLDMVLYESNVSPRALQPGHELLLKTDNGTKVTLYNVARVDPSARAIATEYTVSVSTTWPTHYALDAGAIHSLAQSTPALLRFTIDSEHTLELPRRYAEQMQRDFACLAMTLTEQAESSE